MDEVPKKYSLSTIITTSVVVIIILILAFLLFYFSTRPVPYVPASAPITKIIVPKKPAPESTNIIIFSPPKILPAAQKSGSCFASSVAEPYRQDAFRCMVGNLIYDPCFTIAQKGFVYCQADIDASTGFLIKLTKALPKPDVPKTIQDNWAWFLQLKDGNYCSPFTGTRPFFPSASSGQAQVAYYSCNSVAKDEQVVLLGDLTKGTVWTANEAILVKSGGASGSWTIKSSQQADINTVWQ